MAFLMKITFYLQNLLKTEAPTQVMAKEINSLQF